MMKGKKRLLASVLICSMFASVFLCTAVPNLSHAAPEAHDLNAWNFETGTIDSLGTPQSVDSDGYYAAGVSIAPGGANGSQYALLISGANNGNGQLITGLQPQTAYVLTYWAKLLNCASSAYPNVGVKDYDGSAYQAIAQYTSQWAEYHIEFTTGANSTSALLYTWIFGSGYAELLLDDFSIAEKNHTHTYENGVCACGAVDPNTEIVSSIRSKYLYYDYRNSELQIFYLASDVSGFRSYQLQVFAERYDADAGTYRTQSSNLLPMENAVDNQYIVFKFPVDDIAQLNDNLNFCLACNRANGNFCKSATETCSIAGMLTDRLDAFSLENGKTDTAQAERRYIVDLLLYASAEQHLTGYNTSALADGGLTSAQRAWATRQTATAAQRETDATVSYGAFETALAAGDQTNTAYSGITYNGAVADANFFLLYNTLGYERIGTKKAFVRSISPVSPTWTDGGDWALLNSSNEILARGELVYKGFSFGLQLWEADFTDVDAVENCRLLVTMRNNLGQTVYRETSCPFSIQDELYFDNALIELTIDNAKAREAPPEMASCFFDCNSMMGEAYSHGVFLNGLVQTYVLKYDELTSAQRTDLMTAAQRAFDYLQSLHVDSTGEFIHSDPRLYNADINLGYHNTFEALYGYAAYLYYFKDIDTTRATTENYRRAVKSLEYLQTNYPTDAWYPYREYLIPVCYYLYKYSGTNAWLTLGKNLIETELSNFNLRTMYRSGSRSIPIFEGVYLFMTDSSITLPNRDAWLASLNSIKNTYYTGIDARNAMDILPISDYDTAAAEWDNMWQLPAGEIEQHWQLTTGRAANAMDACFLGELTGDASLEAIATGSLGYIMGLNPGFSGNLVTNPTTTRPMAAAALVYNLSTRHSTGWYFWQFTPANNTFLSVMNGFRIENGTYVFESNDLDDWVYGESFLRHDGAFAYAFCVYERFLSQIRDGG